MKKLSFVLTIIIFAFSCKKNNEEKKPLINNKISKVNVIYGGEISRVLIPYYNNEGKLLRLGTVYLSNPIDTFYDEIDNNNNFTFIKFYYSGSVSGVQPNETVKFFKTNGKLDSIQYKEYSVVPRVGDGVLKHIFEYNELNQLEKEYDIEEFTNRVLNVSTYKNVIYSDGKLLSFERENDDNSFEKVEYSYYPEMEWNTNNFNVYNYFYSKKKFLYYDGQYSIPLFINDINFKTNTNQTALIKEEKISGYYYFDGIKKDYEQIRNMNYVFDDKGRVVEMSSIIDYADKLIIEYEE